MQGDHLSEAVAAAQVARVQLGLGLDQPVHDLLQVVEETQGIPVAVLELDSEVSGAYLVRRDQPFIFLNGSDHPTRQRLTLAHELGHHRLGHEAVIDSIADIADPKDPVEQQAYAFGGEFLAPEQAIRGWLAARERPDLDLETLCRLAAWFGMSVPAMLVRVTVIELLGGGKRATELRETVAAGGHLDTWRPMNAEAVEDTLARIKREGSLPRVPAAMRDNALTAYGGGLIDLERMAQLLRVGVPDAMDLAEQRGVTPAAAQSDW